MLQRTPAAILLGTPRSNKKCLSFFPKIRRHFARFITNGGFWGSNA